MEREDYCLVWIVFLGSCLESESTWKKNIKENNFFMFSFTVKYIKKLNIIKILHFLKFLISYIIKKNR